jgi:hypothetical protein
LRLGHALDLEHAHVLDLEHEEHVARALGLGGGGELGGHLVLVLAAALLAVEADLHGDLGRHLAGDALAGEHVLEAEVADVLGQDALGDAGGRPRAGAGAPWRRRRARRACRSWVKLLPVSVGRRPIRPGVEPQCRAAVGAGPQGGPSPLMAGPARRAMGRALGRRDLLPLGVEHGLGTRRRARGLGAGLTPGPTLGPTPGPAAIRRPRRASAAPTAAWTGGSSSARATRSPAKPGAISRSAATTRKPPRRRAGRGSRPPPIAPRRPSTASRPCRLRSARPGDGRKHHEEQRRQDPHACPTSTRLAISRSTAGEGDQADHRRLRDAGTFGALVDLTRARAIHRSGAAAPPPALTPPRGPS